jgi:hypothetical protein
MPIVLVEDKRFLTPSQTWYRKKKGGMIDLLVVVIQVEIEVKKRGRETANYHILGSQLTRNLNGRYNGDQIHSYVQT